MSDGIPDDVLAKVLEAGRQAPSASNIQPWHFIVVSEPETKRRLAGESEPFIEESAVTIVGCGDPSASPKWHVVDVTIALQNMVIAAWVQGVGSCWIGAFNEEAVKGILGIPAGLKIVALISFGYPATPPGPKWKKSLNQIVHHNEF